MHDLTFFDCNVAFGLSFQDSLNPVADAASLLAEMDDNGVERALAWHIAQHDASPQVGNALLAAEIRSRPRLVGCWTILPNQAGEYPPFETFLAEMRAAGVAALRAFPLSHHYYLNGTAMSSWLGPMADRRIPLFLSVNRGANWDIAYNLLAEFSSLTCVICDHGCWGEDRRFRPLIERYPHVFIDTSQYLLDGGIEAFVASYGPERMLFGSGFPGSYFGGMMMALRHAQISQAAKAAIAAGNLERLLAGADLEVQA